MGRSVKEIRAGMGDDLDKIKLKYIVQQIMTAKPQKQLANS